MRDLMAWAYYMDTDLSHHAHVQVCAKRTNKQPRSKYHGFYHIKKLGPSTSLLLCSIPCPLAPVIAVVTLKQVGLLGSTNDNVRISLERKVEQRPILVQAGSHPFEIER